MVHSGRLALAVAVTWIVAVLLSSCNIASQQGTPRALGGPAAVATIGNVSMSSTELETLVSPKLVRLRADEFGIRRRTLDQQIRKMLLEREASRRRISVEELVRIEVDLKVKAPTQEEARTFLQGGKSRFPGTDEEALVAISAAMLRQRVAEQQVVFVRELWQREGVRVLLEPPRVRMNLTPGPSRGSVAAPVTIIEFTNFQCPHCSSVAATLRAIQKRFGERVRIVLKHYPLAAHKDAMPAAEASVCAEEQSRFWEMYDRLFVDTNSLSPAHIQGYAAEAGVDLQKFNDCLASGRATKRVERDRREGEEHGVTNTPTLFVNGRYLLGAIPFAALETVVDEELARLASQK